MKIKSRITGVAVGSVLGLALVGCGSDTAMSANDSSSTQASGGGSAGPTLLAAATVVAGSFFDQVLAVMQQCGETSEPVSIDGIVARQQDDAEPRPL